MGVTVEVQFAQRLAANEKRTRDRAVKKLRNWIVARSSVKTTAFTEDDMLKLWKGLFYCVWMSDKPLIQEELSDTISNLITSFGNVDAAFLFISCFFQTMHREWAGIDVWRIDKFMMLVRKFLGQCFELLKRMQWDEATIDKLLTILSDCVINPTSDDVSIGLQLHVADIYIEELARVAAAELSGNQLTRFFLPYCHLLCNNEILSLKKTVITRVFDFAIRLCDVDFEEDCEDDTIELQQNGTEVASEDDLGEEEEELHSVNNYQVPYGKRSWRSIVRKHEIETRKLPHPKFDYQGIGEQLLEIAGKTKCSQFERNKMYHIVKKLNMMAKGIFPLDAISTSTGKGLKAKDIEKSVQTLMEDEEHYHNETREWKESLKEGRKIQQNQGNEQKKKDNDNVENEMEPEERQNIKIKKNGSRRKNNAAAGNDKIRNKKTKQMQEFNTIAAEVKDSAVIEESEQSEVVDKLMKRLLGKTPNKRNFEENGGYTNEEPTLKSAVKVKKRRKSMQLKVHTETTPLQVDPLCDLPESRSSIHVDEKSYQENNAALSPLVAIETKSDFISNSPLVSTAFTCVERKASEQQLMCSEQQNPPQLSPDSELADVKNDDEQCVQVSHYNKVAIPLLMKTSTDMSRVTPKSSRKVNNEKTKMSDRKSNRYFNKVAKLSHLKKEGAPHEEISIIEKQKVSTPKNTDESKESKNGAFAYFDKLSKTPPAFFRTAFNKVTPKSSIKQKNTRRFSEGGNLKASAKKVNFALSENIAHGDKDYAFSVENSPSLPFDANKVPAQGVLKLTPANPKTVIPRQNKIKRRHKSLGL